jgi:hypothetical protein
MGANSKLYELVLFYDGFTVRVLIFITCSLRKAELHSKSLSNHP